MIHLNPSVIIEFILGLFLWWVAIYLFTQNPFSRIVQIIAALLASISFYFSSDIFFDAILTTGQYNLNTIVLKSFTWALYLPPVFLYHASLLLVPEKSKKAWQKISLYIVYGFAFFIIYLELFTDAIRRYEVFSSPTFQGNLAEATGKHFYLAGVLFMFVLVMTSLNFRTLLKGTKKYSRTWYKYFWPFLGTGLAVLLGPAVLLSYYGLIPHPAILPVIDTALFVLPLIYSTIRYSLFIEEAKVIFGRNFVYSALAIVAILTIYLAIIAFIAMPFTTTHSLILPFGLAYLLLTSHPVYEWLVTFARDIIYKVPSGYSLVTDEEVSALIRDFHLPERLEQSPLSRLNTVNLMVKNGKAKAPVDAIRIVFEEAIEFFKPNNSDNKRVKKNLKYHLLKMLADDEAEEGQILWELGFEEYPVKIMSQARSYRGPLFQIQSPSDYTYTSRNAYLALKKEAIHDVTWRISYLEKQAKRKLF